MIKVLKFSAVWCGPCRALKPTFDQVRTLIADVVYEEIDVDSDPSATIKYNVHSVPTIVIEKNGTNDLVERDMVDPTFRPPLVSNSYEANIFQNGSDLL